MAEVLAVRNEYRLQNWMEIIHEYQASGLSNKEFCAQRGISERRITFGFEKYAQRHQQPWSHSSFGWKNRTNLSGNI